MKKIFTLPLIVFPLLCNAQLLNGSFEDDGGSPSTIFWEHVCDEPMSFSDAAPSWGLWSIQKQYGNTQGCFPSLVYQTVPDMNNGEIWTLTGWARTDSMYVGTQVGIFLGTKDLSDAISLFDGDQTADPTWTFLSVTDTIQLFAGDTAAVVLSAGLVGGPMFGYAYFDGIQLIDSSTVGIEESTMERLSVFPSPADNDLFIGSRSFGHQLDVEVFDIAGKLVLAKVNQQPQNGSTLRLDVSVLTTGTYIVRVVDGEKAYSARFYKK